MVTELTICNFYGSLNIKKERNKYYWSIEDYDGFEWQEIPKYLYDCIFKYSKENKK